MSETTGQASGAPRVAALALAEACCRVRPGAAGRLLETASPGPAAALLAGVPAGSAAQVLGTLSLTQALRILQELVETARHDVLLELSPSQAANILRAAPPRERAEMLDGLSAAERGPVTTLLSQRADCVGAHVDPRALSMPAKATVGEALQRVRQEHERSEDSLFLTGPDQALVGVVNVRALLREAPEVALERFTGGRPESLFASTRIDAIGDHPCWQHTCVMPVTDGAGHFMGVLHQSQLTESVELEQPDSPAGQTAGALAELYGVGALAIVQWAANLWRLPPGERRR